MREVVYVISEDAHGWRVSCEDRRLGQYASRDEAFAAAADGARASRAAGDYAWVKVRQGETSTPA